MSLNGGGKTFSRAWSWRFDAPPAAVWPVIADTARMNEAAGLGTRVADSTEVEEGGMVHSGRTRLGPVTLAWRDVPAEWVAGRWFTRRTSFDKGPIADVVLRADLTQDGAGDGAGTRCDLTITVGARGLLGRLLAPLMARQSEKIFRRLEGPLTAHFAAHGTAEMPFCGPRQHAIPAPDRIDAATAAMEARGVAPDLAAKLADHVRGAPDVDIRIMRPLTLARQWGEAPRAVVEACLTGVDEGLLGMRWDLLCPRCRGAKLQLTKLGDLPTEGHCPSCAVAFGRDIARNVELTFHPAPAIRPVDEGEYCLFAPMSTPHVRVQLRLAPGEQRQVAASLEDGVYFARPLHGDGGAELTIAGGKVPAVEFTGDGVEIGQAVEGGGAVGAGDMVEITLANRTGAPVIAVLESRAWRADALTAHQATSLQAFRDLFPDQTLRPGDNAGIDRVTLMFTDLRGSTALYAAMGDAVAYRLVRAHFGYLAERVRAHNGALVKTIGDAVMAAFADPADALRAALAIQQDIAAFNAHADGADGHAITVKLGMHQGAAIAVTLNDRFDYFGSTANMAARLAALSEGGDIVLSADMAADPEIAPLIAGGAPAETQSANLKGFDAPVPYVRLRPPVASGGSPKEAA